MLQRTAAALVVFSLWDNALINGFRERRCQRRSLSATLGGIVESTEMKPRRLLVFGFALVAVTLVALVALTTPSKYSARKQRLPDGSFLRIVSVSYGTNHTFALPQRKPWKTFLVTHLPRSWTARLGWWANGGSVGLSPRPGEVSLAIFTVCELTRPTSFSSSPKVVLSDEGGATYDSAFEGAVAGGFDGKHDWKLVGWQLSKIPRDSKWLRLRFSEQSADGRTPGADGGFLNPKSSGKGGSEMKETATPAPNHDT